jgi:hypothetical protein
MSDRARVRLVQRRRCTPPTGCRRPCSCRRKAPDVARFRSRARARMRSTARGSGRLLTPTGAVGMRRRAGLRRCLAVAKRAGGAGGRTGSGGRGRLLKGDVHCAAPRWAAATAIEAEVATAIGAALRVVGPEGARRHSRCLGRPRWRRGDPSSEGAPRWRGPWCDESEAGVRGEAGMTDVLMAGRPPAGGRPAAAWWAGAGPGEDRRERSLLAPAPPGQATGWGRRCAAAVGAVEGLGEFELLSRPARARPGCGEELRGLLDAELSRHG